MNVAEVERKDVNDMQQMNISVGKKLGVYLKEHGITQTWLSNQTGIEQPKIANVLSGKRKLTADELVVIAATLNLDLSFFKD